MRQSRISAVRLRLGGALGAAVLLGVYCGHAFAATGVDILCNPSSDPCATLEIPVDQQAIEVIDHGAAKDLVDENPDTTAASNPATPLAELKSSDMRDNAADTEKSDDVTRDDNLPSPNSRFPGVSDDEALRYRRQMYRTDI